MQESKDRSAAEGARALASGDGPRERLLAHGPEVATRPRFHTGYGCQPASSGVSRVFLHSASAWPSPPSSAGLGDAIAARGASTPIRLAPRRRPTGPMRNGGEPKSTKGPLPRLFPSQHF